MDGVWPTKVGLWGGLNPSSDLNGYIITSSYITNTENYKLENYELLHCFIQIPFVGY